MRYTTLSRELGLKVSYLYTLHIGQHIKTYKYESIQMGFRRKVFDL